MMCPIPLHSATLRPFPADQRLGEDGNLLPIVLITPPPIDPSESSSLGLSSQVNRIYADQVASVAQEYDCKVLDLFNVLDAEEDYWTDGVHLNTRGNALVHNSLMKLISREFPHVAPMTDGNGKYGKTGVPLDGKLWTELC